MHWPKFRACGKIMSINTGSRQRYSPVWETVGRLAAVVEDAERDERVTSAQQMVPAFPLFSSQSPPISVCFFARHSRLSALVHPSIILHQPARARAETDR